MLRSRNRSPLSATLLSAPLLALAALANAGAYAADALPVGSLDARATADVSSATTAIPGTVFSGATLGTSESVIKDEATLGRSAAQARTGALLRDAHRASIFLGGAVNSRLELSLGLHGTYEHVKAAQRDEFFRDGTRADTDGQASQKVHQTAFSGASLFAKLKLLDAQGFKLALAPFIESGAGERATYSLTRSVGPKAGFMAITSYGARGVGAVDFDIGYRYRDPEALGGVTLRNELFYKMLVTADLSHAASLFVAGEGRKLMTAKEGSVDGETGKALYRASEAAETKAGVKVAFDSVNASLYYGQRLKDAKGFGYGDRMAGLELAMELGNTRGARPKNSIAAAIEAKEAQKSPMNTANAEIAAPPAGEKASYDDYPEMLGAAIDPLDALKGQDATGDDFANVDKTLEENKKDAGVVSEDAKIEKELAEVRAAKAKADAAQAKIEAKERAKSNKAARARAKDEEKMMQEYLKDAKKDLDQNYEGIGQDEVDWNGLQH